LLEAKYKDLIACFLPYVYFRLQIGPLCY
jgi:hypothetical protein